MITSLGTCRLVMPLSELTMARPRPGLVASLDIGLDGGALGFGQRCDLGVNIAQAVVGVDAQLLEQLGVLVENILEIHRHAHGRT